MSSSNVSEKIVDIIKKTTIFEKTERIQGIFIGLVLSSSVFGLFTIYNTYKSNIIEKKIIDIENIVKDNASLPKIYYKILLDCQNNVYNIDKKINTINDNIVGLIDDDKNIIKN